MKLLFACALALASSTALARDVHCDRHVENGHTLQKCEFVESPQAAVPPPAPPVPIAPASPRGVSAFLARPPLHWSLAQLTPTSLHCVGREPGA
jgi:hypothetical protein